MSGYYLLYGNKMVMDAMTGPSFDTVAEVLSQTIETIIELVFSAKDVFIEKSSFADLASYLEKIVPLLRELCKEKISDAKGLTTFLTILNREVKSAMQLTLECSKRNKVYLLVNCRSYAQKIQHTTREISRALSLIPFGSLEVSSSIVEDINKLCDNMRIKEFKAAIAEEEILEKIESGIQERNVDRSYANNLLVSIAEALGISSERYAWKKEFEEFKSEIENAQLRKDRAEAIQLEQIIALLERADATSSLEEKEIKYLSKRNSLGSQPLEPLSSFYCPITRDVMVDPVETSSGHTFERSAIEKWIAEGNDVCPISRIRLDTPALRPNKTLRQSIEEWKDRNTMITIGSIKPKLLSDEDDEEVLSLLDQLKDLCEQRDLHREWVVLENYITVLIKLLGKKNREIKNHALVILCILAKDSDDVKERIAKVDNSIESIVHSLGRRIGEGKLAVALLLELSKSESVRDCIGQAKGCILLLVTMSSDNDDQASRDAKELLDNLSYSDLNVIQMAKANYFKHVLQRLQSGSEETKMIMARTLAEMELTDHNKSSLVEEGVLDSLLCLVSQGEVQLKEVAAKALQSLSSLPKNGLQMIKRGCVGPLLNVLYRPTASTVLREHIAVTIMHLAVSIAGPNSSKTHVSMLESDEDINGLFSFADSPVPLVQQSILRAFYALCQSPSASTVKGKLAQGSSIQVLVQLCELDNLNRSSAVNLLSCLIEAVDETTIMDHVAHNKNSIETLIKIIKTSDDEEEIASALGIISNLPDLPQITDWLLEAGGISVIFTHLPNNKHNGPRRNHQIIQNAVGALCRFTVPTNQQSQKKAAEAGVIPILVHLLEMGSSSSTKRRAAICLAQFSKSSIALCRPIPNHRGLFRCFAVPPEAGCSVHQGYCTVESSFCLVEAGAIVPLVGLLGEPDPEVCEAALDALLTLIEGVRLQNGVKVLVEAKAIAPIIKLLNVPSPRLQEKVLNCLERIFRMVEIKQKYGASAQMPLVDLTQRGNSNIKPLAAKILAQLNVLHEQSSYF